MSAMPHLRKSQPPPPAALTPAQRAEVEQMIEARTRAARRFWSDVRQGLMAIAAAIQRRYLDAHEHEDF